MHPPLLCAALSALAAGAAGLTSVPAARAQTAAQAAAHVRPATGHSFAIQGGQFLLDGKPFEIIAGEMHYARIPRPYWRHRLRMAKAMGLNTIATYVFWNVHEPEKGHFDFTGEADLARFIRIAQEEGLYVLLRPGPYVCAEWEFGGFPYWLLNETTDGKPMGIRNDDPNFLRYTQRYLNEVGKQCAPLQIDRGGNILMVQVENEYGSYGSDKVYMGHIRDLIHRAGFTVPLFTADGPSQTANATIPGVLPGVNGGAGKTLVDTVDQFHPGGPYFSPEIYPGWLDHWGEPFVHSNAESGARTLQSFLEHGHSISLYMFHGGTNFGFMNGANYGGHFQPSITSYDYSAPLDEAGRPTRQYLRMRDVLKAHLPAGSVPEIPPTNPVIPIPRFTLTQQGSLLGALPRPVHSENVRTMEAMHQAYGYLLYRTKITGPVHDRLTLTDLRDYAVVLVNGKKVASLDRRRRQSRLDIDIPAGPATLDLLVENGGRINYGALIPDNHKGITESVTLGDRELTGWDIYSLPMTDPTNLPLDGKAGDGPTLYKGTFHVDKAGDSFLDMRGWSKGAVWINGHNLGRYWQIGPQQTLYVPGPWLRQGDNQIVVFEMLGTKSASVAGLTEPILDQLTPEPPLPGRPPRPKLTAVPSLANVTPVVQGDFTAPDTVQTVPFAPVTARYIALESTSAFDGGPFASCAELNLLGVDGKLLGRSKWRILYADSEEDLAEDGFAENLLDGDPGTYWHSLWGRPYTRHPHVVVIDLGTEQTFSAFRYTPRPGRDTPAHIKGYRFYAAAAAPFGAKE